MRCARFWAFTVLVKVMRMAKPGSETAILCGAGPIPISSFSILHSEILFQKTRKSIPALSISFQGS